MGNTSDRVAGDRHGAKAHRSDSSGSHKDQEPSSKMVDSTDDPNIFNTHGPESKVLLLNTETEIQTIVQILAISAGITYRFLCHLLVVINVKEKSL